MNKTTKPYRLEEKSTLELFNAIYKQKKAFQSSKYNTYILIILCFCIVPAIIVVFNSLHIKISIIYEFLRDLLNILSILVGFTLTALSIVGTGLSKRAIQLLSNYVSKQNGNTEHSIYHATILVFFEYVYSLLATLAFIVLCLFLYPYGYYLNNFRLALSILFFYIFILLVYWSAFCIKCLIYNLYCIIMLNAQIATQCNDSETPTI